MQSSKTVCTWGARTTLEYFPLPHPMHVAGLVAPSAVEYTPGPQSVQLAASPMTSIDQLPPGHLEHCPRVVSNE
jgi:hypothetical protein